MQNIQVTRTGYNVRVTGVFERGERISIYVPRGSIAVAEEIRDCLKRIRNNRLRKLPLPHGTGLLWEDLKP